MGEAPSHRGVVGGVHARHARLEVLAGRGGDVEVAGASIHFIHPLPAHDQAAVGIAGSNHAGTCQRGIAACCAAGLDADVGQRVKPEIVVDLGLAEQLVLEVVRELAVAGHVDQALDFERAHLEVVFLQQHLEGHHRQLFQLILRVVFTVIGRAGRNHEDRSLELRNPEVPGFELDHQVLLSALALESAWFG